MVMIGSSGSGVLPGISIASPFILARRCHIYVASNVSQLPLSHHLLRIPITRRGMASFYSVEAIKTPEGAAGKMAETMKMTLVWLS
jgi:hypothetical protein